MRHYDEARCAELDARVRALDWTDEALEFGSPERHKVAEWLYESMIVDDTVRPLFPGQAQRAATMVAYTREKLVEKILGQAISSKASQWNMDNMWTPLLGTSFCAWARQLSRQVALRNARRVLFEKVSDASSREDEEGWNPVWDDRSSRSVTQSDVASLFDEHPRLTVPRPVGGLRGLMLDRIEGRKEGDKKGAAVALDGLPAPERHDEHARRAGDALDVARRAGFWHPSLDDVEPLVAAGLMLEPVPPHRRRLAAGMLPAHWGRLLELYWPLQGHARRLDEAAFNRELDHVRDLEGLDTSWQVLCRLGTVAARLLGV